MRPAVHGHDRLVRGQDRLMCDQLCVDVMGMWTRQAGVWMGQAGAWGLGRLMPRCDSLVPRGSVVGSDCGVVRLVPGVSTAGWYTGSK